MQMLAFIERRKERLWTFEQDMRHQLIERLKDTFGYWSDQSDTFRRKLVIVLNHNWGNTSQTRRLKTRGINCFFKDYDLPLWLSANKWGSLVGKKADTWQSASNASLPAQNHPLSECLLLTTAKLWLELNSGQKHGKKFCTQPDGSEQVLEVAELGSGLPDPWSAPRCRWGWGRWSCCCSLLRCCSTFASTSAEMIRGCRWKTCM